MVTAICKDYWSPCQALKTNNTPFYGAEFDGRLYFSGLNTSSTGQKELKEGFGKPIYVRGEGGGGGEIFPENDKLHQIHHNGQVPETDENTITFLWENSFYGKKIDVNKFGRKPNSSGSEMRGSRPVERDDSVESTVPRDTSSDGRPQVDDQVEPSALGNTSSVVPQIFGGEEEKSLKFEDYIWDEKRPKVTIVVEAKKSAEEEKEADNICEGYKIKFPLYKENSERFSWRRKRDINDNFVQKWTHIYDDGRTLESGLLLRMTPIEGKDMPKFEFADTYLAIPRWEEISEENVTANTINVTTKLRKDMKKMEEEIKAMKEVQELELEKIKTKMEEELKEELKKMETKMETKMEKEIKDMKEEVFEQMKKSQELDQRNEIGNNTNTEKEANVGENDLTNDEFINAEQRKRENNSPDHFRSAKKSCPDNDE